MTKVETLIIPVKVKIRDLTLEVSSISPGFRPALDLPRDRLHSIKDHATKLTHGEGIRSLSPDKYYYFQMLSKLKLIAPDLFDPHLKPDRKDVLVEGLE